VKAVLFEGKQQMRVAEIDRPRPGDGEALLQVAAICGGDARTYFLGDKYTGVQRIPGHEMAGVVAETGPGVKAFRPGDRVALAADIHCGHCFYCRRNLFNMCDGLRILGKHVDGGIAEYMLLTTEILEYGIVNPVPDSLSLLAAAISEPLCSVLASHDELGIQAGETVVVLGSGPMGLLHYELLQARQARVILVDLAPARLERARQDFGAELTINASSENTVEAVRQLTEGAGADVVIAAAPSAAAIAQAIHIVRKRGRVGLFGGLPAAQAEVPIDGNRVHYGEIRIIGNFSYHPKYHVDALRLLASGAVRCDKLITVYPIEETKTALHDIRDGNVFKAVIVPTPVSVAPQGDPS
jgi:L-iditol 2-dehydrogenase